MAFPDTSRGVDGHSFAMVAVILKSNSDRHSAI